MIPNKVIRLPWQRVIHFLLFSSLLAHEGKKVDEDEEELKNVDDMTEDERIAELGRPRLGDIAKATCHIRESMEFKVCMFEKTIVDSCQAACACENMELQYR